MSSETLLRAGEPPSQEEFSRRRGDRRPSTLSQAGTPVAGARPGDGSPQQPGSGSESATRAPGRLLSPLISNLD